MESYFPNGSRSHEIDCDVKIGDQEIALSFRGEDGPLTYAGKEHGEGHFKLKSPSVEGRATLHLLPCNGVLEGAWRARGAHGRWRIHLADGD